MTTQINYEQEVKAEYPDAFIHEVSNGKCICSASHAKETDRIVIGYTWESAYNELVKSGKIKPAELPKADAELINMHSSKCNNCNRPHIECWCEPRLPGGTKLSAIEEEGRTRWSSQSGCEKHMFLGMTIGFTGIKTQKLYLHTPQNNFTHSLKTSRNDTANTDVPMHM